MNADGSVKINDILKLRQFKRFSFQDVLEVVEKNDKKRFAIQGEAALSHTSVHHSPSPSMLSSEILLMNTEKCLINCRSWDALAWLKS